MNLSIILNQIWKDTFYLNPILLKLIRLWMFEIFIYNYHLSLRHILNAVFVSIQFLYACDFVLYILFSFYDILI